MKPVLVAPNGRVTPGVANPFLRRLFRRLFRNAMPTKRFSW